MGQRITNIVSLILTSVVRGGVGDMGWEPAPSPSTKKRLALTKDSPSHTKTKRQQKGIGQKDGKTRRGQVAKRKSLNGEASGRSQSGKHNCSRSVPVTSHQRSTRKAREGVKSTKASSNASLPEEDVVEPQEPVEPVVLPLAKKNLKQTWEPE